METELEFGGQTEEATQAFGRQMAAENALHQEAQFDTPATPLPPPVFEQNAPQKNASRDGFRRAKSSLRLKYEAETHVIERKLGDLESIRHQLGLSQRKMAQLLLVDPSAWTRWTKGEDQAPPHVYRMLQWYLALEEKYPSLDVNFWLNTVAQIPAVTSEFDRKLVLDLSAQVESLNGEVATLRERLEAERIEFINAKVRQPEQPFSQASASAAATRSSTARRLWTPTVLVCLILTGSLGLMVGWLLARI